MVIDYNHFNTLERRKNLCCCKDRYSMQYLWQQLVAVFTKAFAPVVQVPVFMLPQRCAVFMKYTHQATVADFLPFVLVSAWCKSYVIAFERMIM